MFILYNNSVYIPDEWLLLLCLVAAGMVNIPLQEPKNKKQTFKLKFKELTAAM